MRTHPLIDVNHVTPDLELVARVPHEMALYYMALPLAREDGEVSVAIAHPENAAALARLSRLLDGPIVPVRGSSAAIRSLLQAMRPTGAPSTPGILFWSGRAEWQPAAAAWAEQLSRLLDAPVARCDIPGTVPGGILRQRHKLVILGQPINGAGLDIFEQAAGPLFLMRSASVAPLRRILVVLRGFSSDEQVLQWGASGATRARRPHVVAHEFHEPTDSISRLRTTALTGRRSRTSSAAPKQETSALVYRCAPAIPCGRSPMRRQTAPTTSS